VWINGVRADQGEVRKNFKVEEKAKLGTIRFHPMLDWTGKMIYDYLRENNIPHHPLEDKGYFSMAVNHVHANGISIWIQEMALVRS
jgi:phosphoadenosine phosphosulfate reductase